MSTAPQKFGPLQQGERYRDMNYITSEALLSQLILVYDACYQLKVPTEQIFVNNDDELPDLEPGNAVQVVVDLGWITRRKQVHSRSKL